MIVTNMDQADAFLAQAERAVNDATHTRTASEYAGEIMAEIDSDITATVVPATVASFSELHDYVDANDYTIQAGIPYDLQADGGMDLVHDVEEEVTRRLAARAPLGPGYPVRYWAPQDPATIRYGWVSTPLDDQLHLGVTDCENTASPIRLHVNAVRPIGLHPSGKTSIVFNPNGIPREECTHGSTPYDGCEPCGLEPKGE